MNKLKIKSKILLCLILFLITFGMYQGIRLFKSYSYISNTELIRTVIKNTAGFYYDRGNYIQYDNSYMNEDKTTKRAEYFSHIDATRDNIKYVDQISFINNVFKNGINLEISSVIGDLNLENLYKFGNDIYQEKEPTDKRINVEFNDGEYQIDYYDNEVVRLSGSMAAIEDNHYLTMYVKNSQLDKFKQNSIFNKLKETLVIGDILVFDNYILLYIGDGMLMYASGKDYDYQQGIDNYEQQAIKVINIDYLNNINTELYLYNSQEFYVYRFLNKTGYWTQLPVSYEVLKKYYSSEIIPTIRIERFGSKTNNSDIYKDDELTITIKITNNSSDKIIIPEITDVIDSEKFEYISNNYIQGAYLDGNLNFTDISIDANSYREISYQVKLIANEGIVDLSEAKIGKYSLNSITYKIGKKIDFTRLINGTQDIFTNYQKLYNITIDKNPQNEEYQKIIVSNLYGGNKLSQSENRTRYINDSLLTTGDIIFYDNNIAMYINNDGKQYLVDEFNQPLEINVNTLLNSLFSKDSFMIVRPSYLYDNIINNFGDLEVSHDEKIIYLKSTCTYQNLIDKFISGELIEIKDYRNQSVKLSDYVKTGSKVLINNYEYHISLLGDINGDGLINTGDVLKLHRYVLGKIENMENYYLASSYINSDNLINTGDVLKLHRYVLGKIASLEW